MSARRPLLVGRCTQRGTVIVLFDVERGRPIATPGGPLRPGPACALRPGYAYAAASREASRNRSSVSSPAPVSRTRSASAAPSSSEAAMPAT